MTFTSRAYSYIHKESYCSKIQQKKCKKHALELGPHFDPFKAKKTPKACGGRTKHSRPRLFARTTHKCNIYIRRCRYAMLVEVAAAFCQRS